MKYLYDDYAFDVSSRDKTDLEKLADFLYQKAERLLAGGIFETHIELSQDKSESRSRSSRTAKVCNLVHEQEIETSSNDVGKQECFVCNRDNHKIIDCTVFARDSIERRWFLARKFSLCFKCLEQGHSRDDCKSSGCSQCSRSHHILLHSRRLGKPTEKRSKISTTATTQEAQQMSGISHFNEAAWLDSSSVFLKIIPVQVSGPKITIKTFALLDDGSTITLIKRDLIKELNRKGQ